MQSPVGELKLVASDAGLSDIIWEHDHPNSTAGENSTENNDYPLLLETEKQLKEYFEKERTVFTIALDLTGTEFQKQVWEALLTIPFGETRTYIQVAKQLSNPGAVRAVGGAANRNPVPIIVPCHRMIGASGKLVGFGGGLPNKSYLLQIEASKRRPTLW